MEDLTLALITLTSFVLLFVVAIFADRAGVEVDEAGRRTGEPAFVPAEESAGGSSAAHATSHADVA